MGATGNTDTILQERLRRHRRRKRIVKGVFLGLFLGLAAAAVLFFATVLTEFRVEGNENLTDEIVVSLIFPDSLDRKYYYALLKDGSEQKKEVPMIAAYELSFPDHHTVRIRVQEKMIVGGLRYMDRCLYFDEDGYAVKHSGDAIDGIPLIEGLEADHPVLYGKISWKNRTDINEILSILRLLSAYGIEADGFRCGTDGTYELQDGMIDVKLGPYRDMEEKIAAFRDMRGELVGLKGTLHLEEYSSADRYFFERE